MEIVQGYKVFTDICHALANSKNKLIIIRGCEGQNEKETEMFVLQYSENKSKQRTRVRLDFECEC